MRATRLVWACGAVLVLCSCGSSDTRSPSKDQAAGITSESAPTSTEQTSPSSTPAGEYDYSANWPPPLPPAVPTTGEHAWRATWTPEPDAEDAFLQSLVDTGMDASMVRTFSEDLINTGYAMCSFYYDGVAGQAVFNATVAAGKYDAIQATAISVAANRNLCLNVDPWGDSY